MITAACPRNSRKTPSRRAWSLRLTAAAWEPWAFREIFPLRHGLSVRPLCGEIPFREIPKQRVSQFFHILHSVEQQRGCCDVGGEKYEITIYTSCCNADKGIYYYTTYENHQITAGGYAC